MESIQEWLTQPGGVATRLANLRTQKWRYGKDLATFLGWAQSKVSRIENGKQMPSEEDVRAWAEACDADSATVDELLRLLKQAEVSQSTFRRRMRGGQAKVQEDYNQLAGGAHTLRFWETVFVPGPIQVPDYARSIFTEMISLHSPEVDDVDAAVEARMQRQQMLYDPTKSFEFLLAEPVLRWLICPPSIMRSQLDRLQTVIGLPRVRFGIIPMGVPLKTSPQNSVQIYVSDEPVAIVESFAGEVPHRGDVADKYGQVLDRLWDDAVTGEQARNLILSAIRALPKE